MKKTAAFQPNTPPSPGMSVKEARKRLGKKFDSLSDEQVKDMVSLLSRIAQETVRDLGSKVLN